MALILFWIFDQSAGQRRTKSLVEGTLDLIVRLLHVASLPLMGPMRKRLIAVLRGIEE